MRTIFLLLLGLLLFPMMLVAQDDEGTREAKELLKKASRIQDEVAEKRGLEFKSDVTVGSYSKKDLLAFLKKELKRELPEEKAQKFTKAYRHFKLIPDDMELLDAYLTLLGSGIAGFYHPETKDLRLIRPGEEESAMEKLNRQMAKMMGWDIDGMTIAHELCHAAQDQNFDLSTLPRDNETNDDMIMAINGVIEGDATILGIAWMLDDYKSMLKMLLLPYKKGQVPGEAGKLPRYLRLSLTFPYGHGTEFVVDHLKKNEWNFAKANDLIEKLPTSTEQILHPEKYSGSQPDWPTLIQFDDMKKTLGTGAKELCNNVFGEYTLRIVLRENGNSSSASLKAAEGWDGDRYFLFEEGKEIFSVWMSTWDSEKDSKEFFTAYEKGLNKKYKDADSPSDSENDRSWDLGTRMSHIVRKGKDVLVLDNVPTEMIKKVDDLFKAARKSEIKTVVRNKKGDWICAKHPGYSNEKKDKCPHCENALIKRSDMKPEPENKKKPREYP